jgi:hypothetical protein
MSSGTVLESIHVYDKLQDNCETSRPKGRASR